MSHISLRGVQGITENSVEKISNLICDNQLMIDVTESTLTESDIQKIKVLGNIIAADKVINLSEM